MSHRDELNVFYFIAILWRNSMIGSGKQPYMKSLLLLFDLLPRVKFKGYRYWCACWFRWGDERPTFCGKFEWLFVSRASRFNRLP